ncbi:uncharacterized protein LOC109847021 [Asparagus officinalis]|uniref:uncharacterized protein LOC109847021 n=1 Tax=Asparagus officinalis TaxID=4686 RepID=UPI00098E5A64|nr:uncharacterized protein LOC109847021 [Asparagus officinalis]
MPPRKFFVRERPTISTKDLVDEDDDNDNEELIEDEGLDENHGGDPSPNENDGNADVDDMNHNENNDTESDEEGLNENLVVVLNDLIEEPSEQVPANLYDPRVWDSLNDKRRDLLAKKPMITQLENEGYNDWSHVGVWLNEHEVSKMHIHNMATWIELHLRLDKGQTIDKSFQDHIMKEKEHWRKLLRRLISIVKYLAKYNLSFQGKNQRIDKENNENFMGLVQMVAQHDKVMEEHIRRIQNK